MLVGVRDLADIGIAVGKQDDARQRRLGSTRQQAIGTGLPAAVQIGRAAAMNLRQGQVQRLAVTDRTGRDEGLHAVIEDDQ